VAPGGGAGGAPGVGDERGGGGGGGGRGGEPPTALDTNPDLLPKPAGRAGPRPAPGARAPGAFYGRNAFPPQQQSASRRAPRFTSQAAERALSARVLGTDPAVLGGRLPSPGRRAPPARSAGAAAPLPAGPQARSVARVLGRRPGAGPGAGPGGGSAADDVIDRVLRRRADEAGAAAEPPPGDGALES
jgi:hypothetical protein